VERGGGNFCFERAGARRADRALPSEENLRSLDALSAILRQAGLSTFRSERVDFTTNMTTADYTVSRLSTLSGRFIKSSLALEKWREFQVTAINTLTQRFGGYGGPRESDQRRHALVGFPARHRDRNLAHSQREE
jgi:hypothetical protein